MNTRRGFTMIGLLMLIVMLGILAVIAIPLFVDLRSNANQVANDAVALSMGSVAVSNKAACHEWNQMARAGISFKVSKCSDVAPLVRPALTLEKAGVVAEGTYNLRIDSPVATNDLEAACLLQHRVNGITYTSGYVVIGACN